MIGRRCLGGTGRTAHTAPACLFPRDWDGESSIDYKEAKIPSSFALKYDFPSNNFQYSIPRYVRMARKKPMRAQVFLVCGGYRTTIHC